MKRVTQIATTALQYNHIYTLYNRPNIYMMKVKVEKKMTTHRVMWFFLSRNDAL